MVQGTLSYLALDYYFNQILASGKFRLILYTHVIWVQRSDILSTWSGIRPLATDPSSKDTSSISRDHIVNVECPGLITIAGGKWTTYRSMT
ncbi:hypothetical protein IFM89_006872 [Coptis chinensis]|uniref:Uncharacterized protein n=1 Tax=Coptis chinensis TaxID=261450 RepID=A0A835LAC6_9MAGN|nr:hypothetical protein IFM89_006872 [Coptis chinensis]